MSWNILTKTRGGTVSLLKNLTYEEAQGAMQRLRSPGYGGNPWSDYHMQATVKAVAAREKWLAENPEGKGSHLARGSSLTCYYPSDGDIDSVDCWGPEGEEMVVWPKPDDWDERYGCALNVARLEAGVPL